MKLSATKPAPLPTATLGNPVPGTPPNRLIYEEFSDIFSLDSDSSLDLQCHRLNCVDLGSGNFGEAGFFSTLNKTHAVRNPPEGF